MWKEDGSYQDGEEDERHRVGDEDVIPRVSRIPPDVGRDEGRTKDLLRRVVVQGRVEVGVVGQLHLRPELEEARDVEDQGARNDGEGVGQVIVVVAVGLENGKTEINYFGWGATRKLWCKFLMI